MGFYQHINYSFGNEDWNVEAQALRVAPNDTVVCVTASGDRPLHLLMTDCAEIISVDMNHAQNYLLELKICALKNLDFDKYIEFLGCENTPHRHDIYLQLRLHLSPASAEFWDNNIKLIERGVIYQGRTERLTHIAAKFFKLVRPKKIEKLFSFTQIDAQRSYVASEWDTRAWRKLFEVLLNPKISRLLLNDPGLNAYNDFAHPGIYISDRIRTFLDNHLASKSPLLQLLLLGTVVPAAYFPYLTHEGYTKIRARPQRLTYLTGNIIDFLAGLEKNYADVFSLSDIASYMPQAIFENLLYAMQHAAKPGARFCMREFISNRHIPFPLKENLKRNTVLEKKLEAEETNFVYRFMVGEIH